MCGIVGSIAQRNVGQILLQGLKSLEYRGYDSAGMFIASSVNKQFELIKCVGKVNVLEQEFNTQANFDGNIGIAHTRWATHGKAEKRNAHPHDNDTLCIVHNGIFENYKQYKDDLIKQGVDFKSDTDTEVLLELLSANYFAHNQDMLKAIYMLKQQVKGSYALAIIDKNNLERIYFVRQGSPLVIGCGIGENFLASDAMALLKVTSSFIYLQEGDFGYIEQDKIVLKDLNFQDKELKINKVDLSCENLSKGNYKHFMQKEIFEQPQAVRSILLERLSQDHVLSSSFLNLNEQKFNNFTDVAKAIEHIEMVACGTSYHAALMGKYMIEEHLGISCNVSIASEYRYKRTIVKENSLLITISQSGETADTLAALRLAKEQAYLATLAICNVENSALVRESDFALLTKAGVEIGVASTKAFVTQLVALILVMIFIGRIKESLSALVGEHMINTLRALPENIEKALLCEAQIEEIAQDIVNSKHALYLGRGIYYPLALEGALKLKELSYIHAEGFAAGELKHGPIALIDKYMPVVVLASDDSLLSKVEANIAEVLARSGRVYVIASSQYKKHNEVKAVIKFGKLDALIEPIVYTIALQLLAYHIAVLNGTDVDQPRNLAKSVTVE